MTIKTYSPLTITPIRRGYQHHSSSKTMPNKHAAIKDLRKNKRRAATNLRIKVNVKALYKKGMALLKDGKTKEATELARVFQQAVDKAAKVSVVSRNTAARKKSAFMRALKTKI